MARSRLLVNPENPNGIEVPFTAAEEAQADKEEAQAIINRKEWDKQAYARNRALQYPALAEQLDLLWHAIDAGTLDNRDHRNKFYSMLKKVKTDNPKG